MLPMVAKVMKFLKLIKIYYLFAKQSFIQQMQYKMHFWFDLVINLIWASLRLVFYTLAFSGVVLVGDWNLQRSLVLAAVFMLIQAIVKVIFEINFRDFAYRIYNGELDQILLKPVSAQFILSLRRLRPAAMSRLILGGLILFFTLVNIHWQFSLSKILFFSWSIIISLIIVYSLWFLTLCLVFWVGNIDNIHTMFESVNSLSFMPFDIFPFPVTQLLSTIIPLMFIATIPSKMILNPDPLILVYGSFLALLFFVFSRKFWHLALKNYASVSS